MVLNAHTKLYVIEPTVLGHPSATAEEEWCQVYLLLCKAYFALSTMRGEALKHILNLSILLSCLENVL